MGASRAAPTAAAAPAGGPGGPCRRPAAPAGRVARALPALLASLGALAVGCGEAGRPVVGSIHLDPRLPGGGSPAAALDAARRPAETRLSAGEPLAPWAVEGARLVRGDQGARVVPHGDAPAELRHEGPLRASDVHSIVLDLVLGRTAVARVAWRGSEGPVSVERLVPRDEGPTRVRLDVGDHPAWAGTIADLVVVPCSERAIPFRLLAVGLEPRGFRWGDEPLDDEAVPGPAGALGDAGLRRRGHEAVRAWPSDVGVPLLDAVDEVPREGALTLLVSPGDAVLGADVELAAVVDARAPGGEWRRVAHARLRPAGAVAEEAWHPLRADLGELAGGPAELRLLAVEGEPPDPGAPLPEVAPRREAILWGAPEVVGAPPDDPRPHVVLVTLDTTRADALGRGLTPRLDAFAAEGLRFVDAWATCNSTAPSHASILTGLYVQEHGTVSNRHVLAAEGTTLAERFREAGYHTAAAVSVPHLKAGTGFGQGFDRFALPRPGAWDDGAPTIDAVAGWLAEWEDEPRRPRFLWVHLFDPHVPYRPPAEWVQRHLADAGIEPPPKRADPPTLPLYRGPDDEASRARDGVAGVTSVEYVRFLYGLGVSYVDELCGRLLDALDERGLLDEAVVAFVADHGEAIGEHGVWYDHAGLYDETLQVPLLFRWPGGPRGRTVDARVSTVDLAPTLLRLAGLPVPADLGGVDLVRAAAGRADPDRAVWFAYSGHHQEGFRDGRTHFVTTLTDRLHFGAELVEVDGRVEARRLPPIPQGRSFLYEHASDPELERDLAPERPEAVEDALARLRAWREGRGEARSVRRSLTGEEEQRLRDLGYAGDE